jgi:hypothetical protein
VLVRPERAREPQRVTVSRNLLLGDDHFRKRSRLPAGRGR